MASDDALFTLYTMLYYYQQAEPTVFNSVHANSIRKRVPDTQKSTTQKSVAQKSTNPKSYNSKNLPAIEQ